MGRSDARTIPEPHVPTDLQKEIIKLLDDEGIEWFFVDTAGGCNALYVQDYMQLREVVCTNIEEGNCPIFVLDALDGDAEDCTLFGVAHEKWAKVVWESEDPFDFLSVARFFRDFEQRVVDPCEHLLYTGDRVVNLFT